jgi:hypothetical protein
MLENQMTKDPNSIEEFFCNPFSKLPVTPMNKEQTSLFIQLIAADKSEKAFEPINEDDMDAPFTLRLLEKRLKSSFTFSMTFPLKIMVASIANSAGSVLMYLTYLQYKAKQLNKPTLDTSDLANIFPMGFPTDLQDIWDSQKVKGAENNPYGSDNLLDYRSASESIQIDHNKDEK